MAEKFTLVKISSIFFSCDAKAGDVRIPITALAVCEDKKNVFTGCADGTIVTMNIITGEGALVRPDLHDSSYVALAFASGILFSVAQNKMMCVTPIAKTGDKLQVEGITSKFTRMLISEVKDMAVTSDGKLAVVACAEHYVTYSVREDGSRTWDGMHMIPAEFHPTCVAIAPSKTEFIIGSETSKILVVHITRINASKDSYRKFDILNLAAQPSSLAYSFDGKHLAVATVTGNVFVFIMGSLNKWQFEKSFDIHNGRVNIVSWSPGGRRFATGGLDGNVVVSDHQMYPEPPVIIDDAHSGKAINGVAWLDAETLLTVGDDGDVRKWTVPVKP